MRVKKCFLSAAALVVVAMVFVAFQSDISMATHNRGALTCSDCHTMHFSMTDPANPGNWGAGPNGYPNLLINSKTNNAICLSCHDDSGADTSGAPTVYSVNNLDPTYYPGGDFDEVSADGRNGHFKKTGANLVTDDTPAAAPGRAAVLSTDLACWSCHDPHNSSVNANDFRLLRKRPRSADGGTVYAATDIIVIASATDITANESGTNHTVFRPGPTDADSISAWCGACHSDPASGGTGFHGSSAVTDPDVGDGADFERHPTDRAFPAGYDTEYDLSSEEDWRVPFQDQTGWATNTANESATTNDRVMCLTCHRAHIGRAPGAVATYYRDGLRWDPAVGIDSNTACNHCHNK